MCHLQCQQPTWPHTSVSLHALTSAVIGCLSVCRPPSASFSFLLPSCLLRFVSRFDGLLQRLRASTNPLTLAVVGGGAGGVELALALAYRLRQERQGSGGVFTTSSSLSKSRQGQQDTVRWAAARGVGSFSCCRRQPENNTCNAIGPFLQSAPTFAAAAATRLFCRGRILAEHPPAAASALRQLCSERGVQLHEDSAVTAVEGGQG